MTEVPRYLGHDAVLREDLGGAIDNLGRGGCSPSGWLHNDSTVWLPACISMAGCHSRSVVTWQS